MSSKEYAPQLLPLGAIAGQALQPVSGEEEPEKNRHILFQKRQELRTGAADPACGGMAKYRRVVRGLRRMLPWQHTPATPLSLKSEQSVVEQALWKNSAGARTRRQSKNYDQHRNIGGVDRHSFFHSFPFSHRSGPCAGKSASDSLVRIGNNVAGPNHRIQAVC